MKRLSMLLPWATAAGFVLAVSFAGCAHTSSKGASVSPAAEPPKPAAEAPAPEPGHIQVQHILIGFKGSVPGKPITRTLEEARTLAHQVLERAKKGENFDQLVVQYTEDSPPGIYGMSNDGQAPAAGEYPRRGMVAAFGNVGFKLAVGEIGIAEYDQAASPFGFHIIKRLK